MDTNTGIAIKRTDASHPDFKALVKQLDIELAIRDGEEHDFYHQFNMLDDIKYVILVFHGCKAIACGAIKPFDNESMEVKRMYTVTSKRGQRLASKVLHALEAWAMELGYQKCILETGIRQLEAIGLYKKNGYVIIENYGQYAGLSNSVCFRKKLI